MLDLFRRHCYNVVVTIYDETVWEFGAMEFFLLALIEKAGLKSVYSLQKQASLQPGGIRPALKRLESAGLLVRKDEGARSKRELVVTEKGRKFLSEHWSRALHTYMELESVLRATATALLMEKSKTARSYLDDAIVERESSAVQRDLEATSYQDRSDPLSNYMWMRAICESHRRRAEVNALRSVSQRLKKEQGNVEQQDRLPANAKTVPL
jgi:DNA-binding MarR family transcriptional regulator